MLLVILLTLLQPQFKEVPRNNPNQFRQYYLCAETDCDQLVRSKIDKATKIVRLQNYNVSHTPVGVAIFDIRYKGIPVEAVLFDTNINCINFLLGNDIPTWLDQGHQNNKPGIIIIDDNIVLRRTGTTLEVYTEAIVASVYMAEFWKHKQHSIKLEIEND